MFRATIRKSALNWLSTACAMGLVAGCLFSGAAVAQTDSSSPSSSADKNPPGAKPSKSVAAKPSTQKSSQAKSSQAKSSQAKSSAATHAKSSRGARSKSGTSSVARNSKSRHSGAKKTAGKKVARGQQKIDPQRAQAIQEALIREHYLEGEPAGTWNQASEDALRKYQADHGWQSKQVPDSRALISLGLGPSHDGLLNPESAMTTGPDVSHSASANSSPQVPVSHSAQPGPSVSGNTSTPVDAPPQ